VHPIGLPNPLAEERYGGRAGKVSPPNPRMAACLRALHAATAAAGLMPEFEVTFETTHHGPWLETSVMFCEIGSTDTHWGRTDAAEVYASVLATVLRLDTSNSSSSSSSSGADDSSTNDAAAWCTLTPQQRSDATVFICIGGGHYAPRAGDLARKPGVFVGHMLANYSFDWGEAQGWKTAVKEAAAATRTAFPGCRYVFDASVHCNFTRFISSVTSYYW
jgi:D-aminoacyl-tRNA deacylase